MDPRVGYRVTFCFRFYAGWSMNLRLCEMYVIGNYFTFILRVNID